MASLSGFSWWRSISATRPSKWTVPIMSGFRDFQCPGSHDLENSDLPMADIPMTTPRVGTSPAHEDLNPSQLLQIRWLTGFCLDLMAQILSSGALLLQRLNFAQLLPIQRLTGFLYEIRRLSVSSFCALPLELPWT
jgi:hypothetical protein